MRSAASKPGLDREADSVERERAPLDQEDEVEQIAHAAVGGTCARSRVGMELLGPMLLLRERGRDHGPNAAESQPVLPNKLVERL
jgi:hypothetical protein